jgi:hypothetical protein
LGEHLEIVQKLALQDMELKDALILDQETQEADS